MDAYTITYITYGGENPVFAIVAPSNGVMGGMPMPAAGSNELGQMQVPFGQFAMPMALPGPMTPMPMPPMLPVMPGMPGMPPFPMLPNPAMSFPIYSDPYMPQPDATEMSSATNWGSVAPGCPNYMMESKVEIVEEEPEPEDGGQGVSLNLGETAATLDKTTEMMKSLAEKLEKDKKRWSDHEHQGETSLVTETAVKDIEDARDDERNLKGLEILSLLRPKKVVRKVDSDAASSCGRITTESVWSDYGSPRGKGNRRRPNQKRFCCNFILKLPSTYVPVIIGKGGQNTKDIFCKTGCKIRVRGRGSGHMEQGTTEEAPTPLMLAVTAEPNNQAGFVKAIKLSLELLESIEERFCNDYHEWTTTAFKAVVEDEELQKELIMIVGDKLECRLWSKKGTWSSSSWSSSW